MKPFFLFLVLTIAVPIVATAQKEDNVWIYAGSRIDFSTTPPTVTPVGVNYTTEENITSVSDSDGNLVYWLNATSLYNSNDEEVFSIPKSINEPYFYGLSIVPFPGRENVYLFVYPDAKRDRMVMSIADGSKDLLHPEITESYMEFPHRRGDGVPLFFQKYGSHDFWLLYSYDGTINVYAITERGVSSSLYEYNLRDRYGNRVYIDGCEMTPDRSKILASTTQSGLTIFIDLDTQTGQIKLLHPIYIPYMDAYAFSSGNKYLYYSNNTIMCRIPVEALAVVSSDIEFLAYSEFVGNMRCNTGDIKFLTSGGVYYFPDNFSGFLGMVTDCDSDHPRLDNRAVKLSDNFSSHMYSRFLAFPKTYCYPYGISVDKLCGGAVVFSYIGTEEEVAYSWDFGDGDTSDEIAPTHFYTSNGEYTVKLTIHSLSLDRPDLVLSENITVSNVLKKLVIERK